MSSVLTIAGYALREGVRRRVFAVVLLLTAVFLGLYWLGANQLFSELEQDTSPQDAVDDEALAGATLLGLAMFATLFLGCVLAAFLTLNVVRGDADRGLLQPLVVRPVGRTALLVARFLGATAVCAVYVALVYTAAVLIIGGTGDWWPDRVVGPGLGLMGGVTVIVALSLLGSVLFAGTANGIAVFMLFGAGLTAGLLGQIGEALNSDDLETVGNVASWALPFEALYQDGLHQLTEETGGLTGAIVSLGPFGGAQEGGGLLWPWALVYVLAVLGVAGFAFGRRDL